MKLSFLRTLLVALKHASLADASRELNLSPSAVSLQIKQMESYFGRPLFDRSGRQVRPTPFAYEVAGVMQHTLEGLDHLRHRDDLLVTGSLRLGTVESVQVGLLPYAVQCIRQTAPKLDLRISRDISSVLINQVKAGELDFGVLVCPLTGMSRRLKWVELKVEEHVLIAPPDSRGSQPRALLMRYDWIRLDRASGGGRIAAQYVERIAPRKLRVLDLPGTDAIVAMVTAGLGVSVIPIPRKELQQAYGFRSIPLGSDAPRRRIMFVCRPADAEAPRIAVALQAFLAAAALSAADTVPNASA
jgi:DNA-binding transcriptional LysR family regulator